MKIGALNRSAFSGRLADEGVLVSCGPFVVRIRSSVPEVASGLHQLYADFDLLDAACFVDFEVAVEAPSILRRYFRPNVVFSCDGRVPFEPLPRRQAFPLLEWGLNWVISTHAHEYLIVHAAVLERHGRALLLAADPGSGKSTLCAGLVAAGWRLLSDELALISLQDGLVCPVSRPISLKNRSIDVIRALGPSIELSAVCPDTSKGAVAHVRPPPESVARRHFPVLPAWIVFPKYSAQTEFVFEGVGKAHAFMEMVGHCFNYSFLGEDAFEALGRVVDRCQAYRAEYASLDSIVPTLERLVAEGEA